MAAEEARNGATMAADSPPRADAASPAAATQGGAPRREAGGIDAIAARDEATPVRVLAAVIRRVDRWLLCKRPSHKRHGGLWEFPGGKLEDGESLLEAARRELGEELGVRVVGVGDVRFARRDPGSVFVIEFVDVEIEGEPAALEHEEVRWAAAAELAALDLAPSDAAFVRVLIEET